MVPIMLPDSVISQVSMQTQTLASPHYKARTGAPRPQTSCSFFPRALPDDVSSSRSSGEHVHIHIHIIHLVWHWHWRPHTHRHTHTCTQEGGRGGGADKENRVSAAKMTTCSLAPTHTTCTGIWACGEFRFALPHRIEYTYTLLGEKTVHGQHATTAMRVRHICPSLVISTYT